MLVPVVLQFRACMALDHSNAGIMGSYPTQGMNVCPHFSVLCCPVQVRALYWASSPSNSPAKYLKEFILPEVNSESKQVRGPNLLNL